MPAENNLSELLACPRCDKTPLSSKDGNYRCDACKIDFPSLADIPWLFAEPDASLGEWRNRLHFALQQLSNDAQRIKAELIDDDLDPLTRRRLDLQMNAADEHRNMLREILSPVDIQSMQASYESYLALRTRLPIDQGIHTYYTNVHRDWAWGAAENTASLKQVKTVVKGGDGDDSHLGDTLILGAGACTGCRTLRRYRCLRTCRQCDGTGIRTERKVTIRELIKYFIVLEKDDLTVSLPAQLEADSYLPHRYITDVLTTPVSPPLAKSAADNETAFANSGKYGIGN